MTALRYRQVFPNVRDGDGIGHGSEGGSLIGKVLSGRVDRINTGTHTGLKELGSVFGDRRDFLEGGKFRFGGGKGGFGGFEVGGGSCGTGLKVIKVVKDQFGDVGIKKVRFNGCPGGTQPGSGLPLAAVVHGVAAHAGTHPKGTPATVNVPSKQGVVGTSRWFRLVGLSCFPGGPVHKGFVGVRVLDCSLPGHPEVRRVLQQVSDTGGLEGSAELVPYEPGELVEAVAGYASSEDFTNNGGGAGVGFKSAVFAFSVSERHNGRNVDPPVYRIYFRCPETFGLYFPLVLADGKHDVALHSSGWGGGVQVFGCGSEQAPVVFDAFEHFEAVEEGPGEPVGFPYNEAVCFAAFDAFDAGQKDGSGIVTTGSVEFRGEHFHGDIFDAGPFQDGFLLKFGGDERFGSVSHPGNPDVSQVASHWCVSITNSKGASYRAQAGFRVVERKLTEGWHG